MKIKSQSVPPICTFRDRVNYNVSTHPRVYQPTAAGFEDSEYPAVVAGGDGRAAHRLEQRQ